MAGIRIFESEDCEGVLSNATTVVVEGDYEWVGDYPACGEPLADLTGFYEYDPPLELTRVVSGSPFWEGYSGDVPNGSYILRVLVDGKPYHYALVIPS